MNSEPLPRAPADERLVQRYEALRLAPCASAPGGLGRALLMHHGMAAWMVAWARTASQPPPSDSTTEHVRAEARPAPAMLPADVEDQLVERLAQMTCDILQRTTP